MPRTDSRFRQFNASSFRGPDAGGRSAILYSLIESARRHGHEPYAYLKDAQERLPSTTTTGLDALLPANWNPAGQGTATMLAAG